MRLAPISLSLQTLYADLVQKAQKDGPLPAVISRKTIKGKVYLYAKEKHGEQRIDRYLGLAGDPEVEIAVAEIKRSEEDAKLRRDLVRLIKDGGVQGPSQEVGRILEAMSRAGYFRGGLILVGTIAYQTYPITIGAFLSDASMMTLDADFAIASVVDAGGEADLTKVLQRADESFRPMPGLPSRHPPKRFRSGKGFEVEILTPVRSRDDSRSVPAPTIGVSAFPVQYLNYLIKDSITAVALYGDGVLLKVPQPARYAIHKLIVAAQPNRRLEKRPKDLVQAGSLIDALLETNKWALIDALNDARVRGPKWKEAIDRSLSEIGLNVKTLLKAEEITRRKVLAAEKSDVGSDLWKYALLIMAERPDGTASTADLITRLPHYIDIPEHMRALLAGRLDKKFSQRVRNLKSHKAAKTNFIYRGFAEDIEGGFKITEKGREFVKSNFPAAPKKPRRS